MAAGSPADQRLDQIVDAALDGAKKWSSKDKEAYLGQVTTHPLFATHQEIERDAGAKEMVQSMHQLELDDEDDLYGHAMELKVRGTEAYKRGKEFHANAMRLWKEGTRFAERAEGQEAAELLSILHSNIAQVLMGKGQWGLALHACGLALRANSNNAKAAYKATKLCLKLGDYERALALAEAALATDGGKGNKEILKMKVEAMKGLARWRRAQQEARQQKEQRLTTLRRMRDGCQERGIRVGQPMFRNMRGSDKRPYLDDQGIMHWPVVLLYPESEQSDTVEDWSEMASINDLLRLVLGQRLPWDAAGKYNPANVRVFYRQHLAAPVDIQQAWRWHRPEDEVDEGAAAAAGGGVEGEEELAEGVEEYGARTADKYKQQGWVEVPSGAVLMQVLTQQDYVVPDVPVLHIVAKEGADAELAKMRRQNGGKAFRRLPTLEDVQAMAAAQQ